MFSLRPALKNLRKFKSLSSIILDKNEIHDQGIREVADGLLERYQQM